MGMRAFFFLVMCCYCLFLKRKRHSALHRLKGEITFHCAFGIYFLFLYLLPLFTFSSTDCACVFGPDRQPAVVNTPL